MRQENIILTVTGSDGSGGSGVQADLRVMQQMGATAMSAVTCITVQNTLGIQSIYDLPAEAVRRQVEALVNDVRPDVVKVGLLRRVDTVVAVSDILRRYRPRHIVYAPVRRSTRGDALVPEATYEAIRELLLPLCTLVLEPADLPAGERRHGQANQLAAAACVYLSRGEDGPEALLHARTYMKQLPAGYADEAGRSAELYNLFVDNVKRYSHNYADVTFYAEQLNVTPRYLAQVTRRIAQRSPKAIIDSHIADEVTLMLTTTQKPIKEIASLLGFTSQASLTRFYRKLRGTMPSALRRPPATANGSAAPHPI